MARTGYTLPVFAVAAAKAALLCLQDRASSTVTLDLLPESTDIPINSVASVAIEQVAHLQENSALAITRSDPGDNLDLTRDTPIWAKVTLQPREAESLVILGGEGLGRAADGSPAIYSYARRLFEANLQPLIPADRTALVTIILPDGKALAARTSNAAFGILEGLSLLGTSGISKPFSAEEHLDSLRQQLQEKAAAQTHLVFCIGSNGMQVADRANIPASQIVQTGNWIGALLLEAALQNVQSVLLLGYQGKLIKLAGGIFNTSSHLADAKLEIMAAALIRVGGNAASARVLLDQKTADAAYKLLVTAEMAELTFGYLADLVSEKAMAYVRKYADRQLEVATVLFDRQGQIIAGTENIDSWKKSIKI
jgi:cobalt-precorrin-5B (C1)-methyltransferase